MYTLLLIVAIPTLLALLIISYRLAIEPRLSLTILLVLLPFHTLVFQMLAVDLALPPSISLLLQSWKEVVILLLLIWLMLAQVLRTRTLATPYSQITLLLGLLIAIGLFSLFRSSNFINGAYGFRGTFEPLILFFVILCVPLNFRWLRTVTSTLIGISSIVATFAVFQSLYLGFDFAWRYYARDGVLPSSFLIMGGNIQRAMGTFSSPNQLSLYTAFMILLTINLMLRSTKTKQNVYLLITTFILLAALILTVSRSGWVALLIGLAFSFAIWRRKGRYLIAVLLLACVALPILFTFDLDQHLINTFQGNEISANYRTGLTVRNINTILNHPLGVGFGVVGGRAQRFSMDSEQYPTESYLLQLGMELGLLGLIVFLVLVGLIGHLLYQNIFKVQHRFLRAWGVASFACLLAALTHAIFIPDLQDLTVATYLWFIVGIGLKLPAIERQEFIEKQTEERSWKILKRLRYQSSLSTGTHASY